MAYAGHLVVCQLDSDQAHMHIASSTVQHQLLNESLGLAISLVSFSGCEEPEVEAGQYCPLDKQATSEIDSRM